MNDIVIRPQFKLVAPPRREAAVLIPVFLASLLASRQGLEHVLGVVVVALALSALFPIYGWALSRRSRLGLRAGTLEYRGLVRTRVIAARGESVEIVRASRQEGAVWWQVWTGPQWTKVFDERAWSPDDLGQLASAVRATVTEDRAELDTQAFAKKYPGAMPAFARYPRASMVVLSVVLVLVVAWLGDYEIVSRD